MRNYEERNQSGKSKSGRKRKGRWRIAALVLCVCVVFTAYPELPSMLSVFAAEESDEGGQETAQEQETQQEPVGADTNPEVEESVQNDAPNIPGGGTISETPKQSEETDTVLEESAAEQESSDIRTKESAVTQENTAAEESAVLQESTATEEGTVIEEGTSAARPRRAAARAAIVESGTDWTLDADGLLTIASDEGMSDSGNISNKRNVKSISIRRH